MHILGLFIDSDNKEIKNIHKKHREHSVNTAKKIIQKLNGLGYEVIFEELLKETKREHFGRPSIARILMKNIIKNFRKEDRFLMSCLGSEEKHSYEIKEQN